MMKGTEKFRPYLMGLLNDWEMEVDAEMKNRAPAPVGSN